MESYDGDIYRGRHFLGFAVRAQPQSFTRKYEPLDIVLKIIL